MDRLSDYDYHLPDELIAQTPLENRSESRLLHIDRKSLTWSHRRFEDCVDLLERGDLLVRNETRVTARRLEGQKSTGAKVELLLLSEISDGKFVAMAKPGKRLPPGAKAEFGAELVAEIVADLPEGLKEVQFENRPGWRSELSRLGRVPLPPYISEVLADPERYQTVYAHEGGSAAAPTAGLHFTPAIFERIAAKGVRVTSVILDISLDTFRPVQVENLDDHTMHGERCRVSPEAAEAVSNCAGRVIAIGTTSVRTLETFATGPRRLEPGDRVSKLFIRPGHSWQVVDGMFTNFHLPRTTMLVMLSALIPREILLETYTNAVAERYRFLSFGDSMLIL